MDTSIKQDYFPDIDPTMRHERLIRDIRLGIKNLMLHKLRSVLTMLGVVFGVASVVAMLSVGEGASQQAMDQIHKLGATNIIITAMKPVEDESSANVRVRMSVYGIQYQDVDRVRDSFGSDVVNVVPVKRVRKEGRLGEQTMDLRVMGTVPMWFELIKREIIAGRTLADRDMDEFANVAVLTEQGARKLLAGEQTIGQTLRIGGVYYEVIGIVKSQDSQTGGVQTPDQADDVYIPLNVARRRYGDINIRRSGGSMEREQVQLHQMIIQVDDLNHVERVHAGVESIMKRFHQRTDYRISVPLALLRQAEATKRTFNIVLGSIAGISLLVGGIGIMNIMLASVTERTREIGIRRAIGARRSQIISQFLIETVVLSMAGGLIGIALGVTIPMVIQWLAKMPTIVTPYSLILSVGISVGIGIVFGLYPAIRAANLDPIVALRHE